MPEKLQFEGALLDETAYLIPDATKLTISPTIANDLTHILSPPVETLMIYQPADGAVVSEKGRVAMERLMAALKQPEGSVKLINILEHPGLDIVRITRTSNIRNLILLGADTQVLNASMEITLYKPFIFNKLNILASDSLELIAEEDKKLLWARLQQMFRLI